jgi:tetratricopeptide (TPR) repeat protein
MEKQTGSQVVIDLGSLVTAAYHLLPVTPGNTKAVRAVAWAMLANVMTSDYLNRWNEAADFDTNDSKFLLDEAEEAVGKALKIDPKLALAHYAQGLVHRARGEHKKSSASFDNATAYNPAFVRAYAQKGGQQINLGDFDGAKDSIEKALQLGPNDPAVGIFHWHKGRALFFKAANTPGEAGDYDSAIAPLRQAKRCRPNLWYTWLLLASAYALSGNEIEAKKTVEEFQDSGLVPYAKEFTITKVKEYEKSNPDECKEVVCGRAKFHEGLKNLLPP